MIQKTQLLNTSEYLKIKTKYHTNFLFKWYLLSKVKLK